MRLHEISTSYRDAIARVTEAEGEVDDALEADLDALGGALAEKVEACGVVMLELDADADALDAEIKRLTARKRATEAGRARLADYVRGCLAIAGERKIKGLRLTVSLRSSTSVQVECSAEALPEGLRRTKTTVEADKVAIKAALESGATVEGCLLVTRDSVQVK